MLKFKSSEPFFKLAKCFSNLTYMYATRKGIRTRRTRGTSYPAVVHGWVVMMGSVYVHTIGAGIHLAPSMLIKACKRRRSNFLKTLLGRQRLRDVCDAFWTVYGEAVETYLLVCARTNFVHSHW